MDGCERVKAEEVMERVLVLRSLSSGMGRVLRFGVDSDADVED